MKKIILSSLVILLISGVAAAQTILPVKQDDGANLNQADNQKTMNRQQVITNYLQAVANNVTTTSTNVQLKASIFALNWKDSVSKYKDPYYLDHSWQRNTQLLIGGGLDKTSKINSIMLGYSSDLFNHRDLTMIRTYEYLVKSYNNKIPAINDMLDAIRNTALTSYETNKLAEIEKNILKCLKQAYDQKSDNNLRSDLVTTLTTTPGQDVFKKDKIFDSDFDALDNELIKAIKDSSYPFKVGVNGSSTYKLADLVSTEYYFVPLNNALTDYINYATKNGKAQSTTGANNNDLNDLITDINAGINKQKTLLEGTDLVTVYTYINTQYKNATTLLANRPLLSYGYNFIYSSTGIYYQHIPNVQFLIGLGGKKSTHSYEFSAIASDTIATDTAHKNKPHDRNISALQVGINRVFFTDKSSVSLLEATLALEEDHVFSTPYTGENRNKVFASLAFQGRPSAKSPWFKLLLKYNKKANFLGFLDVTMNLDNSSNKTK